MAGNVQLLLGLTAVFISVAVAVVTIVEMAGQRRQVSRSLAAIEAIDMLPDDMRKELDRSFEDRVLTPGLARLTRLGRRFTPSGQDERIRRKLNLAGSPAGWSVDRILAFKMLGLIAGVVGGVLLVILLAGGPLAGIAVPAGSGAIGYFAPGVTLYQTAYNRTAQMRKDLPDALDLLTISVEAGLAFDAAVAQVARNTQGPIAEEFFRVIQEMQIGLGRAEAMRALGDRTDLPELRGFVSAMVQADTFGIPIASVLRVQAREMRIKRTQRAEEMAQKVPVKILFPLIFCILPALFIVVIGPAGVSIFRNIVR